MHPPLLLIDIDGVISLFGFDPTHPPDGKLLLVDGIPHFLSIGAAHLLRGLASEFELVWCSGWEEKADENLPRALGLPAGLPHLSFDQPGANRSAGTPARHWKLGAIDAYAPPTRPLAWIDDAFDETCHRWAAERPGPTELVATDPAVGLTEGQAAALRGWARRLSASVKGTVSPGPGAEPVKS